MAELFSQELLPTERLCHRAEQDQWIKMEKLSPRELTLKENHYLLVELQTERLSLTDTSTLPVPMDVLSLPEELLMESSLNLVLTSPLMLMLDLFLLESMLVEDLSRLVSVQPENSFPQVHTTLLMLAVEVLRQEKLLMGNHYHLLPTSLLIKMEKLFHPELIQKVSLFLQE
jgi:hypothetical protein